MTDCHILGLGHHVPRTVLTNADLERMVDTSDEWITSRTGISERRIATAEETTSVLALGASEKALADAGLSPSDLTHILVATFTPDAYIPSAACVLAHRLGLSGLYAADISAACSGFLYALEAARAITALHRDAVVLVTAAEVVSSRTDYSDRSTCVLFGDGAGSAVVSARPLGRKARILDAQMASDGAMGDMLLVRGGGSGCLYKPGDTIRRDFFVEMQGREVYRHAVRSMSGMSQALLERNGLTPDDIDVFIPHQANMRIIEAVGKRLGIPAEKLFMNVDRYGNTSAASIPIALSEAVHGGFVKPGHLVLITTFGGGFTWGSALVRF